MAGVLESASPETVAGRGFWEVGWSDFSPTRILCVGKAAGGLAAAAAGRWPGATGLVYSTLQEKPPARFGVIRGDHPFPTEANGERTARVRRWLAEGRGPLLACVSGGTSALLVEPRPPWTLQEKLAATGKLWRGGASIRELNSLRAALSSVKAGGLLESVSGSPVRTAIWSDVGPRDGLLVGSAPTIPWRPAPAPATVAARYGLDLPRPIPPRRRSASARAQWEVLFDGLALRKACALRLRTRGYRVTEFAQREGESAQELAKRIAARWRHAESRAPAAFVGCGEALVALPPDAPAGGRCSHLAAAVAFELMRGVGGRPWGFGVLATDGVDGSAGSGAFVDVSTCPPVQRLNEALQACDTMALWEAAGCLLPASPTGNNLRDLWVLADLEPRK